MVIFSHRVVCHEKDFNVLHQAHGAPASPLNVKTAFAVFCSFFFKMNVIRTLVFNCEIRRKAKRVCIIRLIPLSSKEWREHREENKEWILVFRPCYSPTIPGFKRAFQLPVTPHAGSVVFFFPPTDLL